MHLLLVHVRTIVESSKQGCSTCRDLNTMTMSDWQVFISVVSPLVCSADSFPKEVLALWAPLRKALLYFTRYSDGQHTKAGWEEARGSLLSYARLAENTFRMHKLLTHQLHYAVVHLVDLVQAYGPSSFRMEFWVERMMQVLKRVTKFRTSCSPELVAVNCWLLQSALLRLESLHNGIRQLHEKVDPKAMPEILSAARDRHDSEGNCLLGKLSDMPSKFSETVCFVTELVPLMAYAKLIAQTYINTAEFTVGGSLETSFYVEREVGSHTEGHGAVWLDRRQPSASGPSCSVVGQVSDY